MATDHDLVALALDGFRATSRGPRVLLHSDSVAVGAGGGRYVAIRRRPLPAADSSC